MKLLAAIREVFWPKAKVTSFPKKFYNSAEHRMPPVPPRPYFSKLTGHLEESIIVSELREELVRAQTAQVYGFFLEDNPVFVQGDKAGEVCELITANDLNKWLGEGAVLLSKEEALILKKLLKGFIVGPEARKVLDKINAVKEN